MTRSLPEPSARARWLALAATIVLELVLGRLNAPLVTSAAPHGIVSFELARTAANAADMLHRWDAAARSTARTSLLVDYLFLVAYPCALWLGCRTVAARLQHRWPSGAKIAVAIGWGAIVAGCLDAVENASLLLQLSDGAHAGPAGTAFWCASVKFALVLLAMPVALPSLVPWRLSAGRDP